jgi:hypothetical protein
LNSISIRAILALLLLLAVPASLWAQKTRRGRIRRTSPTQSAPRPTTPPAQPQGINLSAQDLALLIEELDVPPQARAQLASNEELRKEFVHDLRQMFALAEEAKAGGINARPEIKFQLELSRTFVIARRYAKKKEATGSAASPEQIVSKEEIAAFIKEAGQEQKFQEFLQDYLKNRPQSQQQSTLTDGDREALRQQWANVMLSARKGAAAGIDKERATEVLLQYQQARLLAGEYFKLMLNARTKATDAELEAYFATHPELDPKQTKAKAEELLAQLRAGGDFNALAKEFSVDTSNKNQGGDLGWFGRGMMVKPFEDAAFALKPGELSSIVETQFGYHIIKLDERRMKNSPSGNPTEEVHARHILLAPPAPAGDASGRPQSPRERARSAVEEAKREKLLGEIVSRSRIVIAEDFDPNPKRPALKAATSLDSPGKSSKTTTNVSTPVASTEVKGTGKRVRTGAGSSRRKQP